MKEMKVLEDGCGRLGNLRGTARYFSGSENIT